MTSRNTTQRTEKSCRLIKLENISSDSNSLQNRQDDRTVYMGVYEGRRQQLINIHSIATCTMIAPTDRRGDRSRDRSLRSIASCKQRIIRRGSLISYNSRRLKERFLSESHWRTCLSFVKITRESFTALSVLKSRKIVKGISLIIDLKIFLLT